MTDAVLEIVVDATPAEAGAARAVRALDDIRRQAAAVEGQMDGVGRSLEAGGERIASSLDAAARSMAALERSAGAGWANGMTEAVGEAATSVGGFFDGMVTAAGGAARGMLDVFGRLGGSLGRMFGAGGTLDIGGLLAGVGRQAGSGLAGLLPAGLAVLGPIAALASGALGGLLGGLLKQTPKVPQGEHSVFLSDLATTQYASTRFPSVTEAAEGQTGELGRLVTALERTLGVRRSADPGAAIGSTLNEKEGLRLFYDAGAADGPDAAGRAWFSADPDNQASVEAARQGFAVAFLKDSDWSAWGETLGRKIADHIGGSAAATVDDLMADVDFIAGFDDALTRLGAGIGDFALSMRAAAEAAGRGDAAALTRQVTGFLDKTAELALPLDAATAAMRTMVETAAGLRTAAVEAPLSRLEEGTARLSAEWRGMAPLVEQLGYDAAEAGRLIESGLGAAVDRLAQDLAGDRAAFVDRTRATLDGRDAVPTGEALFRALGLDAEATPDFFAAIRSALAAGAAGGLTRDATAALAPRFAYQYDLRRIAPEQLDRIAAALDAAVAASEAMRAAQGIGTTTGAEAIAAARAAAAGATDAAAARAAAEAREGALAGLLDLQDGATEAARAAERLADTFGDTARDLARSRDAMRTGAASPLSPEAQLAEAQRAEAAALARVLAGGPDTPEAARGLEQAAARVQELARTVYGSSAQSVAIFATSMDRLDRAAAGAAGIADRQTRLAEAANTELARIAAEIAALRADLAHRATGDAGATLPTFGVAGLGRRVDEGAADFMARRFPTYVGAGGEDAALAWLQQPHESGLGLTRQAYYAAATRAGFAGGFGAGGHLAFLSPGGLPDMNRWVAFIDQLRTVAEVPYGFFGIPYAEGGLVAGGVPGRDSVPALLTPGERVLSVAQSRLVEDLAADRSGAAAAAAVDALRLDRARADGDARDRAQRLEARVAQREGARAEMNAELRGRRGDRRNAVANRAPGGGRRRPSVPSSRGDHHGGRRLAALRRGDRADRQGRDRFRRPHLQGDPDHGRLHARPRDPRRPGGRDR
ncbi:MAG: hypothetical protein AB7P02_03445 [Alphaproteobacteria bacterium]